MHEKIAKIPALREVVMLGYGSMIAKHCVAVPTCSAELLRVNTSYISTSHLLVKVCLIVCASISSAHP